MRTFRVDFHASYKTNIIIIKSALKVHTTCCIEIIYNVVKSIMAWRLIKKLARLLSPLLPVVLCTFCLKCTGNWSIKFKILVFHLKSILSHLKYSFSVWHTHTQVQYRLQDLGAWKWPNFIRRGKLPTTVNIFTHCFFKYIDPDTSLTEGMCEPSFFHTNTM